MPELKARLFAKTGTLAGSEYVIEGETIIGRDQACDIVLYPHTISSRHARIFVDLEKKAYFLEDLNSSNGTHLDKMAVSKPTRLSELHVITLASDIDLIFQTLTGDFQPKASSPAPDQGRHTEYQQGFEMPAELPGSGALDKNMTSMGQKFDALPDIPNPDDTELKPVEPIAKAPPRFKLLIQVAESPAYEVLLQKEETTIGRSSVCDITVSDDFMSGKHAVIRFRGNKMYIEDLGSRNKTYVQSEPITGEVPVGPGTAIRLGPKTRIAIEQ